MSRRVSLRKTRLQYGSDLLLEAGELAILKALVEVKKGWIINADLRGIYYDAERGGKAGDYERTMKALQLYLFHRKIFICKGLHDYWMVKICVDDPAISTQLQNWGLMK